MVTTYPLLETLNLLAIEEFAEFGHFALQQTLHLLDCDTLPGLAAWHFYVVHFKVKTILQLSS